VREQVRVAGWERCGAQREVEVSEVGDQVQRVVEPAEEDGVACETEALGLRFGANSCVNGSQRGGEPLEVVGRSARADVGVIGHGRRAMEHRGQAADEHECDPVFEESAEELPSTELISHRRSPAERLR
jgi:hypothetical protein